MYSERPLSLAAGGALSGTSSTMTLLTEFSRWASASSLVLGTLSIIDDAVHAAAISVAPTVEPAEEFLALEVLRCPSIDGSATRLLGLSTPLTNESSRFHALGTPSSRVPASLSDSLGVSSVRVDGTEVLPAGELDMSKGFSGR